MSNKSAFHKIAKKYSKKKKNVQKLKKKLNCLFSSAKKKTLKKIKKTLNTKLKKRKNNNNKTIKNK